MENNRFFVTGTGTDVGKTIFSLTFANGLIQKGHKVFYWKMVQTGSDSDSALIKKYCPEVEVIPCLAEFKLPASPDQAATHEGKEGIKVSEIETALKSFTDKEILICEGAGGIFVPLNKQYETWLDLLQRQSFKTLIVAQSNLGTINHTSLTIDSLCSRNIEIDSVILSGEKHNANIESLTALYPNTTFLSLPLVDYKNNTKKDQWHTESINISEKILSKEQNQNKEEECKWGEYDKKYCWHPYTQHQSNKDAKKIVKSKGVWLYTEDNLKLFDATSSWWVNSLGHSRWEIGQAILKQQSQLDHVIFADATHKSAAKLAQKLCKLTGEKLSRTFYSDNGSCAVEIALKMAIQGFHNKGNKDRTKILSFEGAYHGDTFGTMSAGASDGFHGAFKEFMFETIQESPVTIHPSTYCPEGELSLEQGIKSLEKTFHSHGKKMAAAIIEPLAQGASGMNIQSLSWLKRLGELCKEYEVPLILDEVFTGLGRIGEYFAFMKADIDPDIVCIAKGLTGGTLPLAVTLAKEDIFKNFLATGKDQALLHGHSFTGNAIACAAALETLEIYEKDNVLSNVSKIESTFRDWLNEKTEKLGLMNPRTLGAIMAFELPSSKQADYFDNRAEDIKNLGYENGLFLRPLGNTLYLVPPLVSTEAELEFALVGLEKVINSLS